MLCFLALKCWYTDPAFLGFTSKERISYHTSSIFFFNLQKERTFSAKKAAPFLGEFQTDDVPTIRRVVIRHRNGKLLFYVNEFQFHLNHVRGMTFELIDRRKVNCLPIVIMGVNHEKVHFHPPITDYISPGFTVFGFNLQGKAYFYRKANKRS